MRPRPVTSSPRYCPSASGSKAPSTATPWPPVPISPTGLGGARMTRRWYELAAACSYPGETDITIEPQRTMSQQRSIARTGRRGDTLRSSQLRVGGGEFVKFVCNKAAIGPLVATFALLLALAITGTTAYWTLAAWGAVIVGAYAFFAGRSLG
jgi:hypothetical protein